MRQTTPRRPGKPADSAPAKVNLGAGDHLDLGMIVSVYCAEAARRAKENAVDEASVPPDIIEH